MNIAEFQQRTTEHLKCQRDVWHGTFNTEGLVFHSRGQLNLSESSPWKINYVFTVGQQGKSFGKIYSPDVHGR